MTGAVMAAAVKMAAALRQQRREVQLAKPKAQLVAGVHAIVTDSSFYSAGPNPTTSVHILDRSLDLLRPLFDHVMNTAADDAAGDYHYVDPAKTPDYSGDVQDRAEYQAQHIQKLHDDIQQAKKDNQSLDQFLGRIASYGDALVGAYNAGYAGAVLASAPDAKIIWELGATEHCAACLDRAGKEFTFKSLPGYPGDGDFGGDICEGGPRCGCSLNFVRNGASASRGTNTQRADAIQWYDQQLTNAEQRRADNAQARSDFVSSLPEGPQSRAVARDTVRQDAARDANAASSYQGVSTEPRDISAATVAAGVGKNFNPSEPRDGHGRWAPGGAHSEDHAASDSGSSSGSGGGVSGSSDEIYAARASAGAYQLDGHGDPGIAKMAAATSIGQFNDAARLHWMSMGKTFAIDPALHSQMTPEMFKSIQNGSIQAASLMKAYPQGAADLRWVSQGNMKMPGAMAYTHTQQAYSKSQGKWFVPKGTPSSITVDASIFKDGKYQGDPTLDHWLSGGPKGTDLATVVVTHEFGHVLDASTGYQASDTNGSVRSQFAGKETAQMSGYARSGGGNTREVNAEAFADVTVNGSNASAENWALTGHLLNAATGDPNPVAWTVGGSGK